MSEVRDRNIPLKWRTGHLDPATRRRRIRQRRRYKLSEETMDRMLEAQSHCCAICKVELIRPIVDHDHETGAVRGLTCASCNTGLGQFEDDEKIVLEAYFYLRRFRFAQQQLADTEDSDELEDPLA